MVLIAKLMQTRVKRLNDACQKKYTDNIAMGSKLVDSPIFILVRYISS